MPVVRLPLPFLWFLSHHSPKKSRDEPFTGAVEGFPEQGEITGGESIRVTNRLLNARLTASVPVEE